MGWKTHPNFFTISCADLPATGQACRQLTVRRGRRFGYVASIGLPITNHPSTRFACSGRASHLSLFTFHQSPPPSHFSLITLRRANACSAQASHLLVRHSPAPAGRRRITAAPAAQRCASRISSLHPHLEHGGATQEIVSRSFGFMRQWGQVDNPFGEQKL